jgi:hypothetical protein
MQSLGKLVSFPIKDHLNLVAEPTSDFLIKFAGDLFDNVGVAEIDPTFSDTAGFCEHYGIPLEQIVNCVIIKATGVEKNNIRSVFSFWNYKS